MWFSICELVGKDANSDLAVISVKLSDLAAAGVKDVQVAEFGDSDSTQVGWHRYCYRQCIRTG